ncbi:3-oxoacyl-ACP synthase III family protein [Streptomyces acidiscabies]|uniref:Ketoacyl-ACP synthase III n=1 Tax=Streptomyces acidiscabies TaxID=42234 RepID=A0AAP6BGU0_9ACTN|nr:ketoacyl-ACP synthase III [Streptomyces acidiscabies]MBP5935313.1 ketoacyl-ACP synthase III [Streptomyces sp. LBUM 1476]MBZ3916850.1 ketoacyl-ACP synthase III [Streptomyces acidiscabies]MDX2964452.1 ketoacyl-ACP synthase III [Streptomyces acidiscabies]MDX3023001.1 ketoacyl-ACP synthase III [Streptomyces acidiscabies]MDX3794275.1 ketoacyl-ACP synthase III [Streptomyces acidiscabies]
MPVGILGIGSYLPENEVSSADIAQRVGVTEEWILSKTKIETRRFAADDEATSDLAARAARAALASAGLTPDEIGTIIVSTSTPDSPQPATACLVQNLLGARRAAAFDVNAVCSGFVYALALAEGLIAVDPGRRVLVVAADLYSRSLDFGDRRTAVLLGDGAGAAVVGEVGEGYGIQRIDLAAHGDLQGLIRVEAGGTRRPASHETVADGGHFFRMEGRLVREFVLEHVPAALGHLVREAGVPPTEVGHIVPHQPNGAMLDELDKLSGFPNARLHRTVERYGNVGSASVPVTLDAAHREGALDDGDLVLLTSFGGGMSTGHCLLRWRQPGTR